MDLQSAEQLFALFLLPVRQRAISIAATAGLREMEPVPVLTAK